MSIDGCSKMDVHDLYKLSQRGGGHQQVSLLGKELSVLVDIIWPISDESNDSKQVVEVRSLAQGSHLYHRPQRRRDASNSTQSAAVEEDSEPLQNRTNSGNSSGRRYNRLNINFVGEWKTICKHGNLEKGGQLTLSGHGIVVKASSTATAYRMPTDHPYELWVGLTSSDGFGSVQASFARPRRIGRLGSTQPAFQPPVALDPRSWSAPAAAQEAPRWSQPPGGRGGYTYVPLAELRPGRANVYGVVVGFTSPRRTSGTDYLMTVALVDQTSASSPVQLSIFAPSADQFPDLRTAGDVLRVHRLTVEVHADTIKLLARKGASFLVQCFQSRALRSTAKRPSPPDSEQLVRCRQVANALFLDPARNHLFAQYACPVAGLPRHRQTFADLLCCVVHPPRPAPPAGLAFWVWDGTGPEASARALDASFARGLWSSVGALVKVRTEERVVTERLARLHPLAGQWVKLRGVKVHRPSPEAVELWLNGRSSIMVLPPHHNIVRAAIARAKSRIASQTRHAPEAEGARAPGGPGRGAAWPVQHAQLLRGHANDVIFDATCPTASCPGGEALKGGMQATGNVYSLAQATHAARAHQLVRVRVRVLDHFPGRVREFFVQPEAGGGGAVSFALLVADRTSSLQVLVRDDRLSTDATRLLGLGASRDELKSKQEVAQQNLAKLLEPHHWLECYILKTKLLGSQQCWFRLVLLKAL